MKYMLDTSPFNRLADGLLKVEELPPGSELVATYVQIEEINRTKDEQRRLQLLITFTHLEPTMEHTASFIWGKTPWGLAPFGIGESFNELKAELDFRNKSKPSNTNDALIAETALTKGYGLVTADRDLAEVFAKRSAHVMHVAA